MAAGKSKEGAVDEVKLHVTSVFQQKHEHVLLDDNATIDEQTLGALGYKQEFKR